MLNRCAVTAQPICAFVIGNAISGSSHYEAQIVLGVFIIPGIAIGQFLGGFITKRLGLLIRGCFHLALLCSIGASTTSVVWLLYCDRNDIYGMDTPYKDSTLSRYLISKYE